MEGIHQCAVQEMPPSLDNGVELAKFKVEMDIPHEDQAPKVAPTVSQLAVLWSASRSDTIRTNVPLNVKIS